MRFNGFPALQITLRLVPLETVGKSIMSADQITVHCYSLTSSDDLGYSEV